MASTTASCQFCGAPFVGYGSTHAEAAQDARSTQMNHEMSCSSNPANQD